MEHQSFGQRLSPTMAAVAIAALLCTPAAATAQALKDVKPSDKPLVLTSQGSFFVGGEKVEQTQGELGDLGPGGHITVNQMYVRYMVPQGGESNLPVVMVHGATLTGKSWETTPDGRMGWDEYFVRKGHPVYVPDQVGRGREPARRRPPTCLGGSDSVTKLSGRIFASGRNPMRLTATANSQWPRWMNCQSRVCPT